MRVQHVPSQAAQYVLMLRLVVLVQQESGLTSRLSSVWTVQQEVLLVLTLRPVSRALMGTSLTELSVYRTVQLPNGAIRKTINVKPVHLLVKTVKVQVIDAHHVLPESSSRMEPA